MKYIPAMPFLISRLVLIFCVVVFLVCPSGCSKKKSGKRDFGKPTWQKVEMSELTNFGDYSTDLEGGIITIYEPKGWERQPPSAATVPKGFKSVIVLKKKDATLMMTKSRDSKELPDIDGDNVLEFAEMVQQAFKVPVKMVALGNITGVLFNKQVQNKQRSGQVLEKRILATAINGQLFTYEIIADKSRLDKQKMDDFFALISKTTIRAPEDISSNDFTAAIAGIAGGDETASATDNNSGSTKPTATATATTTETASTTETTATTETASTTDKPNTETDTGKLTTPAITEVAAAKPAAAEEKPKSKPKPAKSGNTKNILAELDALLN
ncbi:MAG: hypothetical protein ACRCUY_01660 [Thermoguttaceae bacterium]